MDTLIAQPPTAVWPVFVPQWPGPQSTGPQLPGPQAPGPHWPGPTPVTTRGLSPSDFPGGPGSADPATVTSANDPQPAPTPSLLSDIDRAALRSALDVLKDYPGGRTNSTQEKLRVTSAIAYTTAYLEAKGLIQPPSLLSILLANAQGAQADPAGSYDDLVSLLTDLVAPSATRAIDLATVKRIAVIVGTILVMWGKS